MGIPGVSCRFIFAFILVIIGTTLHLIGLSTPEWSVDGTSSEGLFHTCSTNCSVRNYAGQSTDQNDSIRAAAAMNVIGALFALACFMLVTIHLGMGCLRRDPSNAVPVVAGALALIAFCFILIGVAVWGGAVHDDNLNNSTSSYRIGYSFALSITGGIILLLAGLILIIGKVQIKILAS